MRISVETIDCCLSCTILFNDNPWYITFFSFIKGNIQQQTRKPVAFYTWRENDKEGKDIGV